MKPMSLKCMHATQVIVREALEFSARLRIPESVGRKQVHLLFTLLLLAACNLTLVGLQRHYSNIASMMSSSHERMQT